MNGKVMTAVIQIKGLMSDSVKKAVNDVNKHLGVVDKKALATAAKLTAMGAAAATAAGTMAAAFVTYGNGYIRTMNNVAAQTGVTGKALEEMGEIAKNIYKSGKGESLQEITDALVNIKQTSGLAGKELEAAANGAVLLKDTFGMEVNETTRAASALMKNFGISAEKAYGIITVGAQKGANKNGDLLDTLNEYSVHYKALGLNADQFITSLIKGAEAGAFSIDKVGDAVKEFNIRAKDGSKTSAEGFETLGLNAELMTAAFAAGGESAQAAFSKTIKALDAIKDPVAKNAAGVALFGTMFEDLEAGVLKTLGSMSGATVDAEAALRKIEEIKYKDIGYAIRQISRSFEVALIPSAEKAGLEVYKQMPAIKASIDAITPTIETLGMTFAAALPGIISGIADAAKVAADFAGYIIDNWGAIEPVVKTLAYAFGLYKLGVVAKEIYDVGSALWAAVPAMKAATLATWAGIKAKVIDKAETLQLYALYAKDAVMKGITTARLWAQVAAQGALTVATGVWTTICTVASVATSALGAAVAFLTSPIGLAIAAIAAIVAAGVLLYKNWDTIKEAAFALGNGIVEFFTNAFSALPGIIKQPINAVIGIINGAINGINGAGFVIPDWVPIVGGKAFKVGIPNLPMLATGGFTNGLSIAGEAGTEAVISFDPAYRTENIGYLAQAAEMLGVSDEMNLGYYADKIASLESGSLTAGNTNITYNLGGIVFSPTVTVAGGDEKKGNIMDQLRNYQGDLLELIEELLESKEAGSYGTGGVF